MNQGNHIVAPWNTNRRVALFLPSLAGGGAEKIILNVAYGLLQRSIEIDLVLSSRSGQYLERVPPKARVVDLSSPRPLRALPRLVQYLRAERPRVLFSTLTNANVAALIARRIANTRTPCVVREASTLSEELFNSTRVNRLLLPRFVRWLYPQANAVVAPSNGVADDLSAMAGLQREAIRVIYNPVISASMLLQAREKPDHPWFRDSQIPVVLGIGRLSRQKNFETLIRAFAWVRRKFPARLIILGEGEERLQLEQEARNECVYADVALPGFVDNPYAFLGHAKVFALSSRWEGLPNALIEALACGISVVSTNCPHGPAEVLADGRYGQLVPVGDVSAMAHALLKALTGNLSTEDPKAHIVKFHAEANIDAYLELLVGILNS